MAEKTEECSRGVQGARTSERRDSVTCARDSPRHVNRRSRSQAAAAAVAAAKPAKERSTNGSPCQWALNGRRTLLFRARNERRRERKRPDTTTRRAPAYVRARARREWDKRATVHARFPWVGRSVCAGVYACMYARTGGAPGITCLPESRRDEGDSSPRNAYNIA